MLGAVVSNTGFNENRIINLFEQYFERRGISLLGTDFKQIPNSTYEAAFMYVANNMFQKTNNVFLRGDGEEITLDIRSPEQINQVLDVFEQITKSYDFIAFDFFFMHMIKIDENTLNGWMNETREDQELNRRFKEIWKRVRFIGQQQVKNKLGNDKIGVVTLANNDAQIGLEYNQKRQVEAVETRAKIAAELPQLNNLALNLANNDDNLGL